MSSGMLPSDEHTAPSVIGRREAIRRAALLAGVVVAPEWLLAIDPAFAEASASAKATADKPAGKQVSPAAQGPRLTPAHAAIAGAVADRILPRTDTPGAADVGVPAFIDRLYGEFMTPAERQLLTDGLTAVDAAAKSVELDAPVASADLVDRHAAVIAAGHRVVVQHGAADLLRGEVPQNRRRADQAEEA